MSSRGLTNEKIRAQKKYVEELEDTNESDATDDDDDNSDESEFEAGSGIVQQFFLCILIYCIL